jgi:hypothetical protein
VARAPAPIAMSLLLPVEPTSSVAPVCVVTLSPFTLSPLMVALPWEPIDTVLSTTCSSSVLLSSSSASPD